MRSTDSRIPRLSVDCSSSIDIANFRYCVGYRGAEREREREREREGEVVEDPPEGSASTSLQVFSRDPFLIRLTFFESGKFAGKI